MRYKPTYNKQPMFTHSLSHQYVAIRVGCWQDKVTWIQLIIPCGSSKMLDDPTPSTVARLRSYIRHHRLSVQSVSTGLFEIDCTRVTKGHHRIRPFP